MRDLWVRDINPPSPSTRLHELPKHFSYENFSVLQIRLVWLYWFTKSSEACCTINDITADAALFLWDEGNDGAPRDLHPRTSVSEHVSRLYRAPTFLARYTVPDLHKTPCTCATLGDIDALVAKINDASFRGLKEEEKKALKAIEEACAVEEAAPKSNQTERSVSEQAATVTHPNSTQNQVQCNESTDLHCCGMPSWYIATSSTRLLGVAKEPVVRVVFNEFVFSVAHRSAQCSRRCKLFFAAQPLTAEYDRWVDAVNTWKLFQNTSHQVDKDWMWNKVKTLLETIESNDCKVTKLLQAAFNQLDLIDRLTQVVETGLSTELAKPKAKRARPVCVPERPSSVVESTTAAPDCLGADLDSILLAQACKWVRDVAVPQKKALSEVRKLLNIEDRRGPRKVRSWNALTKALAEQYNIVVDKDGLRNVFVRR